MGFEFQIGSLGQPRFFGISKARIDERPFFVTNCEGTIVDAPDLPRNAGGVGVVAGALRTSWARLNALCLRECAERIGNSTVTKRLGLPLVRSAPP